MKPFLALLAVLLCTASVPAQNIIVRPYVQPGDGSVLGKADVKVIAWLTDQTEGDYQVEYGTTAALGSTADKPARTELAPMPTMQFYKYAVELHDLPFNSQIHYQVKLKGKGIGGGVFSTRKTPEQTIRFAMVGDTGDGKGDQRKIAWQMAQAKPELLLIAGDIVYTKGTMTEYLTKFWPVYNDPKNSGSTNGAQLFNSLVLYPILGNHDVGATNLTVNPDGFAGFYFYHPPLNGPKDNPWNTPVPGPADRVAAFKKAAGPTYPGLCNYSFDDGPAHFLCLDANRYVTVTDPKLQKWIKDDLTQSKARWKFVFFHHPGFQSSIKHYAEQKMRLLTPLFEACGVDVVFSGHVHNYQRSKPFTFKPDVTDKLSVKGNVAGKFKIDDKFDGKNNTKPEGIIYIVSGGGGASLYDPDLTDKPEKWEHNQADWAPYTTKFVSDRHSFSLVEVEPNRFTLRQIDDEGKEVDRCVITKGSE